MVPSKPERAGDTGQVVGQRGLAQQRLGDAGLKPLGDRDDFVSRVKRPGANQDRDLLTRVEHVGGLAQTALSGNLAGPA